MKWVVAIFIALVFGVLSFNAFIGNSIEAHSRGNKFISMFVDIYGVLINSIGSTLTGVLFAVGAIGIVVLAFLDGRAPNSDE